MLSSKYSRLVMFSFWLEMIRLCSSLRLETGENLEENQRNLLRMTDRFFQAIISSSGEFPPQLRSVCHCLFQVRLKKLISSVCSLWMSVLMCMMICFSFAVKTDCRIKQFKVNMKSKCT